MIGVLLVFILFGSVFFTSRLFLEPIDEPKSFYLLITALVLLIACSLSKKGLQNLMASLKSRSLFIGITIVCLLTTVHGLLQYYGFMPTLHRLFPITGAFDNPAGFAAVQAAMFPFVFISCFDKENRKGFIIFCAIVSLMCLASVILSGSRTGFLAICAAIAVVLALTDIVSSFFKSHPWLWLPITLLAVTLMIILYYYKQDSADGRIFIWSRCFDMIKERPLFGYGRYGFQGHYMMTQAEYFRLNPDSPYIMIADNVISPFNEYIKLTVNYGLVGLFFSIVLLLSVIRKLFNSDKKTKVLGLSFVASVFVMCQFSYPFQYNAMWLLIFFAITPALIQPKKELVIPGYFRIIFSTLLIVGLGLSLRNMYYEMKWTEIAIRARKGRVTRMLPYYEEMKSVMISNPLFFYNYSAELNYDKRYKESLDIIKLCSDSWNDYNVQILYTDNYAKMGNIDSALIACDLAYNMIPCRFEPLYRKMLIYGMSGDTVRAVRTAYEILEKPVKVHSEKLNQMISTAENVISHFDDD